ncbi:Fe-S cluster assembly protein SufD [Leptodesmis sichuanensis]|uniref:Fe-S cluster assembly protein SufD n=1 Tax=Leptodesmis sichuanensis TaxID=2906798 RepID=UPI001F2D6065|nr:Fe-S cluster assembly protein SufD [Leptodesmis sichuanensis]UIE39564.1 Fe-S cluster assembly protein SufD [Leptodesmis sichuanensis A121]
MTIQVSTVPEVGDLGISAKPDRAAYLTALLNLRPALTENLEWLQPIRDRATSRVEELAIPSTREEEWRFTDLSALLQVNFATAHPSPAVHLADIAPFILPEATNSRLVFVNGNYAPELSAIAHLPSDLVVTNLEAACQDPALRDRLTDYLATQPGFEEVFTALNTASFTDAAVILAPRNQAIATPVHLLFISTAEDAAQLFQPRCLVIAESNSTLTVIEDYVALGQGVYFTNPVTEIWLEGNAQINHTRIQRDHTAAFHIGKTAVSQDRDSRYTCTAISLGAALSRHNLEIYQTGEQTETTLSGLTMIGGEQVADTHSAIAYTKPHGTSQQVHKCIVDHRAHAVFNGKVFVPKAAQLTDARQLSKNLLLSSKARVDTKPQLEITADNVKCTHGATVSQLDTDEVFYLQSRGIDADSARKLLVYAFAYEVISQIPVPSLQNQLTAIVRTQQDN